MMIDKRSSFGLLLVFIAMTCLLLVSCDALNQVIQPQAQPTLPPVQQTNGRIIVEGRLVPKESANLFFTLSGEVSDVLVAEGDIVKGGDLLARLGDRATYEAALTAAELEQLQAQQQLDDLKEKAELAATQASLAKLAAENALRQAQAQLDAVDTDATQKRIDDARQAVIEYADGELKEARENFDKYKDLDADNANRKSAADRLEKAELEYNRRVRARDQLIADLALARERVRDAQAALDQAQRDLAARQDGPDPDLLALAEARLKNAQAQVAAAQSALDRLDLRAPFDGVVTRMDLTVGERILPNQVVLVLADFSEWYVETTDLTENEVVEITPGQSATILLDALPEATFTGKVESISQYYLERAGDILYTVKILVEDPDERLRWGMTAEVRFEE